MAVLATVIGAIYFQVEDNYAGFQNRYNNFIYLRTFQLYIAQSWSLLFYCRKYCFWKFIWIGSVYSRETIIYVCMVK